MSTTKRNSTTPGNGQTDEVGMGMLEHLDPHAVVIEANIRPDRPVTGEFVQSIRDHGVMVPVLGYRDPNGNVLVRAGQRRTLGAREAGAPTIPVYVVEGGETTARRIIDQLIENEHREALADADRAAAWQQLAFEGLTATAIAKKTGAKIARVKQGLAVAENATARTAIVEHQLNLEQAATLGEFEDDEHAITQLIETAEHRPEQFTHTAQRLRDQRERARKLADATAAVTAAGFIIRDREPGYQDKSPIRVADLATSDGEPVTADDLTGKDGVTASVATDYRGEIRITYWIDDPKAHGFVRRRSDGTVRTPMTDEQKAERRELIANNKAWASAEKVRREWLAALLTRKTLPKDAAQFIAEGLTAARATVSNAMSHGNVIAHQILGIESAATSWGPDRLAALVQSRPTRAQHVTIAIVIGGIENATGPHTWRSPSRADAAYLTRLASWGYTLSDVEQLVINPTAGTGHGDDDALDGHGTDE